MRRRCNQAAGTADYEKANTFLLKAGGAWSQGWGMIAQDPRLVAKVRSILGSCLFATISGAHLYGFRRRIRISTCGERMCSPCRRCCAWIGIGDHRAINKPRPSRWHRVRYRQSRHQEILCPAAKKNGYVLEQLYSPLVIHTTPEHEELKAIARVHHQAPQPPLLGLCRDSVEAL